MHHYLLLGQCWLQNTLWRVLLFKNLTAEHLAQLWRWANYMPRSDHASRRCAPRSSGICFSCSSWHSAHWLTFSGTLCIHRSSYTWRIVTVLGTHHVLHGDQCFFALITDIVKAAIWVRFRCFVRHMPRRRPYRQLTCPITIVTSIAHRSQPTSTVAGRQK